MRGHPHAGFRQQDLDRLKSQTLNLPGKRPALLQRRGIGQGGALQTIFAGTPYGHIPAGLIQSVRSITLDDVRTFYHEHYTRDNVVIGLGGGYDAGHGRSKLRARPGHVAGREARRGAAADAAADPRPHVTIVEKDATATAISLGFPIDVLRGQQRLVSAGGGQFLAGRASQPGQPSLPGDPRVARAELRRLLLHRALPRRRRAAIPPPERRPAAADLRDLDSPRAQRGPPVRLAGGGPRADPPDRARAQSRKSST